MVMRSKLAWKLSAVVVVIMTLAIMFLGYASNLICAHYSLESARAFLGFNTESISRGVGQMMMSRNNEGIGRLINEMSEGSTDYRDIQLVSHHSGEVVVSRFGPVGNRLAMTDQACAACHAQTDPVGVDAASTVDLIAEDSAGDRILSVMVPVFNEPSCRDADCHAHADSSPILGFIRAEYSLGRIDSLADDRRTIILVTVLGSLFLGVVALWFMFTWLLARPIGRLIDGTKRIAAGQFDFRFDRTRRDEIGILEESFNAMTGRIKAHRDELRTTLDYLGGIVESSDDLIITVTIDGFIETFNRGAERALGYSRAEVIGRPIEMLFADPHDREVAIAQLEATDKVRNYETRFLTKDGQIRNVLLTLSYLRDRDGEPIGTFGISKDITQEKQLLRELVQAKKLAAIGQTVTGIQHAIKNMLNALKGGAYLLRTGIAKNDQPQIEEGWAMVDEGIERISNLALSMLKYADEWKPELQKVDLGELVAKICDLNRQPAADRGVTLRSVLPEKLPLVVCDPKLIHLAVTDLVLNAVDACAWKDYPSGESPEVVVETSLSDTGSHFVIEVRDNGCGMTEETRQDIFRPFFSTKKTGTGLGLALTNRVMKIHRGEVTVESEPDRGSTFRVRLPIDGPSNRKETADDEAGSHH
jgi:two-component system NtrC family sensor kinase